MTRVLVAVVFGTTLAIGIAWTAPPADPVQPVPTATLDYKLPAARFHGHLSCAAASCHASGDAKQPGGEYSTWADHDPHFRAYDVLFNDRSRRMIQLLHGSQPGKPGQHTNRLCEVPRPRGGHADCSAGEPLVPAGRLRGCHGPASTG